MGKSSSWSYIISAIVAVTLILPVGILLIIIGFSLRAKSIRETTLTPVKNGYGYTNPVGVQAHKIVFSQCSVLEPRVNCTMKSTRTSRNKKYVSREYCYARLQYESEYTGPTGQIKRTLANETTVSDFSETTEYYSFFKGQTVPCFTDAHRPDIVSLYRYKFPTPTTYVSLITAGFTLIGSGLFFMVMTGLIIGVIFAIVGSS